MALIEFLRARLNEDEQVAQAAAQEGAHWSSDTRYGAVSADDAPGPAVFPVVYDEGRPLPEQAVHIARWDPARTLAEVEVKRRILGQHLPSQDDWPLLRIIALPYAGHKDYRKEWKP